MSRPRSAASIGSSSPSGPMVERLTRAGAVRLDVIVDGTVLPCYEGETIATALLASRSWIAFDGLRRHALLCGIGACSECVVEVDGRRGVRACLAPVAPGMRIRTVASDGASDGASDTTEAAS